MKFFFCTINLFILEWSPLIFDSIFTYVQVKHMVGSSNEDQNNIEENTHIAYLCDLLERIWGHGLKKREVGYS